MTAGEEQADSPADEDSPSITRIRESLNCRTVKAADFGHEAEQHSSMRSKTKSESLSLLQSSIGHYAPEFEQQVRSFEAIGKQ